MFQNQVSQRMNSIETLGTVVDRCRWYSGFVGWSSLVRLRHVTSGLYLAVIGDESGRGRERKEEKELGHFYLGPKVTCISKKNASAIAVTFEMKMTKVSDDDGLGGTEFDRALPNR